MDWKPRGRIARVQDTLEARYCGDEVHHGGKKKVAPSAPAANITRNDTLRNLVLASQGLTGKVGIPID